jgi:ribonucleotide monophosphatase NagD (HAD superfamily)
MPQIQPRISSIESTDRLRIPDFESESFLDVNFEGLANHVGSPIHVVADLDHTLRIPSDRLGLDVINHVSQARSDGVIESFNIGTDNIFGRYAPGALQIANRIYRPFVHDKMFIRKPHPAYFGKIIDDIQVPPSTIIMIGNDNYRDIYGANQVGMTTVQVPPIGSSILVEFARHHRGRRFMKLGKTAVNKLLTPQ